MGLYIWGTMLSETLTKMNANKRNRFCCLVLISYCERRIWIAIDENGWQSTKLNDNVSKFIDQGQNWNEHSHIPVSETNLIFFFKLKEEVTKVGGKIINNIMQSISYHDIHFMFLSNFCVVSGICMIPTVLGCGASRLFEIYTNPALKAGITVFVIIAYVIPVCIIVLCYAAILKTVWGKPALSHHSSEDEEKRRWKQRIQMLKTIAVIVTSNVLHFGYFFAVLLWIAHGGHTYVGPRVSSAVLYSATLVAYLSTCINPPLYALLQPSFRPFVYKILCPKRFRPQLPGALVGDSVQREPSSRTNSSIRDKPPTGYSSSLQSTELDTIQASRLEESTATATVPRIAETKLQKICLKTDKHPKSLLSTTKSNHMKFPEQSSLWIILVKRRNLSFLQRWL